MIGCANFQGKKVSSWDDGEVTGVFVSAEKEEAKEEEKQGKEEKADFVFHLGLRLTPSVQAARVVRRDGAREEHAGEDAVTRRLCGGCSGSKKAEEKSRHSGDHYCCCCGGSPSQLRLKSELQVWNEGAQGLNMHANALHVL